jgi:hypothetical protein
MASRMDIDHNLLWLVIWRNNAYPHRVERMQQLEQVDEPLRFASVEWPRQQYVNNPVFFAKVLFTDDTWFKQPTHHANRKLSASLLNAWVLFCDWSLRYALSSHTCHLFAASANITATTCEWLSISYTCQYVVHALRIPSVLRSPGTPIYRLLFPTLDVEDPWHGHHVRLT